MINSKKNMRLNLNSTEESDIKEECLDGVKVIVLYIYYNNDFVSFNSEN